MNVHSSYDYFSFVPFSPTIQFPGFIEKLFQDTKYGEEFQLADKEATPDIDKEVTHKSENDVTERSVDIQYSSKENDQKIIETQDKLEPLKEDQDSSEKPEISNLVKLENVEQQSEETPEQLKESEVPETSSPVASEEFLDNLDSSVTQSQKTHSPSSKTDKLPLALEEELDIKEERSVDIQYSSKKNDHKIIETQDQFEQLKKIQDSSEKTEISNLVKLENVEQQSEETPKQLKESEVPDTSSPAASEEVLDHLDSSVTQSQKPNSPSSKTDKLPLALEEELDLKEPASISSSVEASSDKVEELVPPSIAIPFLIETSPAAEDQPDSQDISCLNMETNMEESVTEISLTKNVEEEFVSKIEQHGETEDNVAKVEDEISSDPDDSNSSPPIPQEEKTMDLDHISEEKSPFIIIEASSEDPEVTVNTDEGKPLLEQKIEVQTEAISVESDKDDKSIYTNGDQSDLNGETCNTSM